MIITFITIGIIIAAITCLVIANRTCADWAFGVGILLVIIAFFSTIFVGVGIINTQANKDVYYQNVIYEKEMLEYRIDNMEDNIIGNEMLYNDIVEFNNGLRSTKKWANSPWTNWMYNQDIATIDYIELNSN